MSNLATIEFYWSYLREYRWGLLTGEKGDSDSCLTKARPSMDECPPMQEIQSTAQPAGSLAGWAVSFPGDSVSQSLFQAAWLLM